MPPPPKVRAKLPALTVDAARATAPAAVRDRPPPRTPDRLPPSNAAALAALRAGDRKPLADPSRKDSQDKVGNGAVAAGLARSPGADPKFAVLKKDVARKKHTVAKSHPPANQEATSAQKASVPPKDDEVAQGKTANAEKMNEAEPKDFDKAAFIEAVEKAIAEKAPKNLEQADDFAGSGKPAEIKAEVQGKVGEGKTDSARQIADTTAAPPDTSVAEVKQVVPMTADRPPGTPATPDPANAAPDKLPPSATDLSAGPASVDKEMADNQVTEKQLATDPAFSPALKEKKVAEQHSEATPPELRQNETRQLRRTTAQAKHFGAAAMGAIAARRAGTGRLVDGGKETAKTGDQDKRAEVTALLQKVFDTMKTDVEGILTGLDKLVDDQFTKGEKEARDAFTAEHRRKMDEYKDRRYSGGWGLVKWGHDKLFGLPEEANQIFVEARDHYVKRMRDVISAVADTIGRELTRAKQRIATGRAELRKAVESLPKDLKALGTEAAAGFADKFDELTQSVDDKSTELVDTLATKYTDAVKSVDAEIAAEKEKNRGLVDKALDAVKGVIKTILELKDLLLGVLAKAAQAVLGILKDPIGFLGNLVSAVGGGLKQFKNNALAHLQQGVLSWLLGTAATAGIELPTSFDVVSILVLLASLLGLSGANLLTRIKRKAPRPAMAAIEAGQAALPIIAEVRKHGVRALWDDLKSRVGDLKKTLIDNLVSYLLPTIVLAGITWIISLFNPASAFIRACKMIIDIIRFIVTNGKQIIEFVNTVLDAVIAIAKGGAGGVAGLVEKALARSIPVLIGALAALLGLGGIAGKVKEIFQKLARPVNKAIDWVVDKIVGLVKKLWAKLKPKKRPAARRPGDKREEKRPERDKGALDAALREAHDLVRTGMPVDEIEKRLPPIRRRHRLTALKLVVDRREGDHHVIHFAATINPAKESRPENSPLSRKKAQADYGILVKNGRKFQRFADANDLIIEVRPTNPESIRHLMRGAWYKPVDIKAKTIQRSDTFLGIEPEKRGLVGFFVNAVPQPKRRGLDRADVEAGRKRHRMRVEERREYGAKMKKLARKPLGPGRFEVLGYVVHGYDENQARHPIAGDHDLYDIRRPDGTEIPIDEYELLIEDMREREFGVMHGAVVRWNPRDPHEREMRDKLVRQHQRGGGEGLVRFAPGQPMRFVVAETPQWTDRRPWHPPAGRPD
ncbi:hypothetical protein ABZ342_13950 [Amycolatopsis sp. NPDC005961]|uniref:hypothetical protein n=1 Tax=Amycolatopsis sp. NPDC005961 TaxID=3156720 RepID=UPI0033D6F21C